MSPTMELSPATTQVKCMYSQKGEFLGLALVQVGSEADAERIRRQYSGQIIDGSECMSTFMWRL